MFAQLASLTAAQWVALALNAVLVGLTKAGLEGASILAIPIMAQAFGARSSSAIMLGIMIVTDWAALWNYHAQVDYKILVRTLPAAIVGIALGTLIGKDLSEATFKLVIGIIILVSTAIMFVQELKGGGISLPKRWYVAAPLGLLTGFSSTLGNAGGPVFGLYLLSCGLLKGGLLGTTTLFFATTNVIRLPLTIFVWRSFTIETLGLVMVQAPLALAAVFFGVRLVRRIPEKPYRYFRLAAAGAGGAYLLLQIH